jgi:hypothetical protein
MFEPISQSLYEIMMFSILGFFLSLLYEPLRIVRLFVKTGAITAGIQDFLFLAAGGVIVFAYSLEFGAGYFRYFYIIGVVFGAAVYFLTAGKLINYLTRTFANAIKIHILRPLRDLLVKIAQKSRDIIVRIYKVAEKRSKDLKSTVEIKYNSMAERRMEKKREMKNLQERQNEPQKSAKPAIKARVVRKTEKA